MIEVIKKKLILPSDLYDLPEHKPPDYRKVGLLWQELPHWRLYDAVFEASYRKRWGQCRFLKGSLSKDTKDCVMIFHMKPRAIAPIKDQIFCLGIVNSNAQRSTTRFYAGTWNVFRKIGFVSKEIILKEKRLKHTFAKDINRILDKILLEFEFICSKTHRLEEDLKNAELKNKDVSRILTLAGKGTQRTRLMGWIRIEKVMEEWRNPRYEEFVDTNSWSLMNIFSMYAKKNPPLDQLKQLDAFRKLLPLAVYYDKEGKNLFGTMLYINGGTSLQDLL